MARWPSPQPSPAATREKLTGGRVAGEGATCGDRRWELNGTRGVGRERADVLRIPRPLLGERVADRPGEGGEPYGINYRAGRKRGWPYGPHPSPLPQPPWESSADVFLRERGPRAAAAAGVSIEQPWFRIQSNQFDIRPAAPLTQLKPRGRGGGAPPPPPPPQGRVQRLWLVGGGGGARRPRRLAPPPHYDIR